MNDYPLDKSINGVLRLAFSNSEINFIKKRGIVNES